MADLELDALAGEHVLGTLDTAERTAFLRRLVREPEAAAAVAGWQARLAPLALALPPVEPPATLFSRIEGAIDGGGRAANDNGARWRIATAAATVAALIATGVAFDATRRRLPDVRRTIVQAPAPVPVSLSAVGALSAGGETPVLFLAYDEASGRVQVVPAKVDAGRAHSLELWIIRGKAAPKSLGLIDTARAARFSVPGTVTADSVFAVSREPLGGSKTGLPTGPVLFTGSLVRL